MSLRLIDDCMFRDALDGVHGLDPRLRQRMRERFADVSAEVARRTGHGEYGFLALGRQPELVLQLNAFVVGQRGKFDHLLVLGIGGSALGTKALLNALKAAAWNELPAAERHGFPTLTMLENVDPVTMQQTLARLNPRRTLVNVISKSGGTAETLTQYLVVRAWLEAAVGDEAAKDHLIFTTDPAKGALRTIAQAEDITAFDVPPDVCGRFSVLTAVGLVPAAILGIDIDALLAGARDAADHVSKDFETNAAARWSAWQWQAQASRATNIHVLMPYCDRLRAFAEWYRQLWAESLGKRADREGHEVHRGPTPVGAVGATDQHSQLQLFIEGPFDKTITFVRVLDTVDLLTIPSRGGLGPELSYLAGKRMGALLDAELTATREALRTQGRMSCTLEIDTVDARHLGRLIMFFQIATGYAGVWYDVNPFDQPGVELGKVLTGKAMGREGY